MHDKFLICFGSQRGGTTWLSAQLRKHPECDFPYRKEIRYLDPLYYHPYERIQRKRIGEFSTKLRNFTNGGNDPLSASNAKELRWWSKYAFVTQEECTDEWYASLFDDCDPSKLTGDFSPDYSLLPPEGVDHLYRVVPNAKLIFMLRNPIDRLWSGVTYALRERDDLSIERKSARAHRHLKRPMQLAFSNYPAIIQNFERRFPKENILYLFHDDISNNATELLQEACTHLEISYKQSYFPKIGKSINRSPEIPLDPNVRAELSKGYLPDLRWLSERFGGRATSWLQAAEKLGRSVS